MIKKDRRKLKNFLINKKLQFSIIINSIIYLAIAIFVVLFVTFYPLIFDMIFSNDLVVKYNAMHTFFTISNRIIPTIIIILTLFAARMIIIMHKICGPLENFVQTCNEIAQGNLTRKINIREGDYLKDVCVQINYMIDSLSNMVKRIMEDHKALMKTLEDVKYRTNDLDIDEKIRSALETLRQETHYIKNTLYQFKV